MSEGCCCGKCVKACTVRPGWFMPGEAEKAAAFLGMPFKRFQRIYLIWDWWSGESDIKVLSPFKQSKNEFPRRNFSGGVASWGWPFQSGRCVFLTKDDRCKIHEAKPYECRMTLCCRDDGMGDLRQEIAEAWKKQKEAVQ